MCHVDVARAGRKSVRRPPSRICSSKESRYLIAIRVVDGHQRGVRRGLKSYAKMPLRGRCAKLKGHVFLDVDMAEVLTPVTDEEVKAGAGSKLVITLGPSCQDVDTLVKMLQAGVTCARVDLTWGTMEYHRRSLENLGVAMRATKRLCSVWLDTTGREVIVRRKVEYDETGWPCHGKALLVNKGDYVTLTGDPAAECSASVLPVNWPGFADVLEVGSLLQVGRYLSSGAEGKSVFLTVAEKRIGEVVCMVENDARLDGLLTVMVCRAQQAPITPSSSAEDLAQGTMGVDLALPVLTEMDVRAIKEFSKQFEIDFISLSYTNSAEDVYNCRSLLDAIPGMAATKIIAKLERRTAVQNFEAILLAADGIILSRGNMGLDFDAEVMALLQKHAIARCNRVGKPVLLTRLVDTMVHAPRPTRAEATDIANGVLDGADGFLLAAETLRGEYPLETVETVLKLAHSAEKHFDFRTHHELLMGEAFEEEVALPHADSSGDLLMIATSASQRSLVQPYFTAPPSALGASLAAAQHSSPTGPGLPPLGPRRRIPTEDPPSTGSAYGSIRVYADGSDETIGAQSPPKSMSLAAAMRNTGAPALAESAAPPKRLGGLTTSHQFSSFGNLPSLNQPVQGQALQNIMATHAPFMTKLESIASSAVRVAEKINAGLIIVMAQTGRTVSLVAKYRPPMPVLAVVVPTLRSNKLGWMLEGKYLARQTQILRGVVPLMAAPMTEGSDDLLAEAIASACQQGLVRPSAFVVCILSQRGNLVVKVVQVDSRGLGMKQLPGATHNLMSDGMVQNTGLQGGGVQAGRLTSSTLSPLRRPSMSAVLESSVIGPVNTLTSPFTSPFGGGVGGGSGPMGVLRLGGSGTSDYHFGLPSAESAIGPSVYDLVRNSFSPTGSATSPTGGNTPGSASAAARTSVESPPRSATAMDRLPGGSGGGRGLAGLASPVSDGLLSPRMVLPTHTPL